MSDTFVSDADETVNGFYADSGLMLVQDYAQVFGDTDWEVTVGVSREEDDTPISYVAVSGDAAVEQLTQVLDVTDRRAARDRHKGNHGHSRDVPPDE